MYPQTDLSTNSLCWQITTTRSRTSHSWQSTLSDTQLKKSRGRRNQRKKDDALPGSCPELSPGNTPTYVAVCTVTGPSALDSRHELTAPFLDPYVVVSLYVSLALCQIHWASASSTTLIIYELPLMYENYNLCIGRILYRCICRKL